MKNIELRIWLFTEIDGNYNLQLVYFNSCGFGMLTNC